MRFQKFKGQKFPTCFKQGFQQKNGGYLQLINMANSRPGLTEEGRTLFKETKKAIRWGWLGISDCSEVVITSSWHKPEHNFQNMPEPLF